MSNKQSVAFMAARNNEQCLGDRCVVTQRIRWTDFHVVCIIYWKTISVIIPNLVKCLLFRNLSFVKPEGEETCLLKYFENS
jgi:hypothetical protein